MQEIRSLIEKPDEDASRGRNILQRRSDKSVECAMDVPPPSQLLPIYRPMLLVLTRIG